MSRKTETLGFAGLLQRPPDPFPGAGVHQKAVGIVQFAAEVVAEPPIGLADEIHRRQRRQTERRRRLAREQSDVRVDEGLLSGVQIEAEGAGRRFAVEQRIDDDMLGHRVRRLDPEFAKERELLVDAGPAPIARPRAERP